MDEIIIRNYNAGDFSQILELWKQTGLSDDKRGDDEGIIITTLKHGGKFLILEDAKTSEIIGTSWITTDARRSYLHHFGIKPSFQGHGHANLLMEKSMQIAKEMGLQIKIEVHQTNIKAMNLYEKYGFKYLGDYNVLIIRDWEVL